MRSSKLLAVAIVLGLFVLASPFVSTINHASAQSERACRSQQSVLNRAVQAERRAISDLARQERTLNSLVGRLERDLEKQLRDAQKCEDRINRVELTNQVREDNEYRKRARYISDAAGLTAQALQCGFGFLGGRPCDANRFQLRANALLRKALVIEQRIPQIRDQNSTRLANEQAKCERTALRSAATVSRSQARVEAQIPKVDASRARLETATATRAMKEAEYNACLLRP